MSPKPAATVGAGTAGGAIAGQSNSATADGAARAGTGGTRGTGATPTGWRMSAVSGSSGRKRVTESRQVAAGTPWSSFWRVSERSLLTWLSHEVQTAPPSLICLTRPYKLEKLVACHAGAFGAAIGCFPECGLADLPRPFTT